MLFKIGIENGDENRSVAWVLEHPGCFAYGLNDKEAVDAAPQAIEAYACWVAARTPAAWIAEGAIEVVVEDVWNVYGVDEGYEFYPQDTPGTYSVNAWFRSDWKPLTEAEIQRGLDLLAWSRADLLQAVSGLSQADMEHKEPGERWSIAGILGHVGGADWWYMDRLGLVFQRSEVPVDPFERLDVVRAHLNKTLPVMEGKVLVLGKDAEFWSPRKLLRRAVWHERDHTQHIMKLIGLKQGA